MNKRNENEFGNKRKIRGKILNIITIVTIVIKIIIIALIIIALNNNSNKKTLCNRKWISRG